MGPFLLSLVYRIATHVSTDGTSAHILLSKELKQLTDRLFEQPEDQSLTTNNYLLDLESRGRSVLEPFETI